MMTGSNRYAACRHCLTHAPNRPRGLCGRCYGKPAIRDLYEAKVNQHSRRRELGLAVVPPTKLPTQPTRAPRGSEEKIKIMRERLERDEHLHHEEDGE